ncbi:phosphoenolpyruvate--protein phosphotransferase [Alkalispirochaeta americana]|uniref:phosphoenolpyruvate--protein phosphotransferase n=1 Tax=Alkalispirochaeta americana TaxID=159291 RepID=UPI0013565F37|nr:phosphoenolpyruvate--protein phosphotransferase [Alkalispirochaeta americana]
MTQFNSLALINAVTDLAELLGRRTTVEGFLQDLVATVANHLGSDVCSVYLYDVEQDLLVLRATRGLNPLLLGKVRLNPGEGLTGQAFLKNSPILERNAAASSMNKAIPDLGEDDYPAFLGVPIKRNDLGIGVLTLQYRDADSIDPQALRALRTLASHLASTLENVAALYELHEEPSQGTPSEEKPFEAGLLQGTSASRGIAIGLLEYLDGRVIDRSLPIQRSIEDAIELSTRQLQELQHKVDQSLSDVALMIFSSHLLMLRDESFVGRMVDLALDGSDPREAVESVVADFSSRFAAIPDPRFQEKAQDVQDLGNRIMRNLQALEDKDGDYRGHVVVVQDLFPSELVKLHLQKVEGVIFAGGGATSHVAILAQSLHLPVVGTGDPRLFSIPSGVHVVVDAEDGKVIVAPGREVLEAYRQRLRPLLRQARHPGEEKIPSPLLSADGIPLTLLANANLVKDARSAFSLGAQGIGLYRSEFPFLIRNGFPTEEEQYNVYLRVVEETPGLPVGFRTLDLGGDKLLSSQVGREDNPFLGYRGIRFLLDHRDLFRDQLRAMLRAGHGAEISIQFPMIASLDEFRTAREEVLRSIADLQAEGIPCHTAPQLGVMVELPATIEIARDLAQEADFFSIGTNDLIMYMLAADRANHRVASLYRSVHPGVLRALQRLTEVAHDTGRPISVCGATAEDPAMILFYLGIGITRLSVDATSLLGVARILQGISLSEAQERARRMLSTSTLAELDSLACAIRGEFSQEGRE